MTELDDNVLAQLERFLRAARAVNQVAVYEYLETIAVDLLRINPDAAETAAKLAARLRPREPDLERRTTWSQLTVGERRPPTSASTCDAMAIYQCGLPLDHDGEWHVSQPRANRPDVRWEVRRSGD